MFTLIRIYNILLWIIVILAFPVILLFIIFSEKRRKTVLHRLTLTLRPSGLHFPIWIHALSVGEVLSAVPFVRGLKERMAVTPIVFSASTYTGFETARKMLGQDADEIIYFPYDLSICVKRAIRQIKPSTVVIVETDIWPNFLFNLKKQNIPAILINARLSERSFSGYRRLSFLTRQIFGSFSKICCQTKEDAARFKELCLYSDTIAITGNLKFDQPEISPSDDDILYLQNLLNHGSIRKVIVAGSTHEGEEKILYDVFLKLKEEFEHLLLLIAPRDPKRSINICNISDSAIMFSELEKKRSLVPDLVVIDKIGILRKLYATADIAFVGGSLVRCGGHNPLEPAICGKPVIFGPDMSDFQGIAQMLLTGGGAVQVNDAHGLYHILYGFLKHRQIADKTGKAAFDVFSRNKGAVKQTIDIISALINPDIHSLK